MLAVSAPTDLTAQDEAAGLHYASPWKTPWTYEGPRGNDHWSQLDSAYSACAGKEQSPIDIRDTIKNRLPALRFQYHTDNIRFVTNNGHTIRINYARGNGNYLLLEGRRYELTQFHFHRPSEERIHGKAYDMVLHVMHQGADGEVLGLAILLQSGPPNPLIQQIWRNMPASEGNRQVAAFPVNVEAMLPKNSGYYAYTGSQTAPPCSENVRWIVLKKPVSVSPEEIREFAALYPDDARPVQPLNGRIVKESR